MAYEGVGGVGYLLGTLLGKALGGETANDRERKRRKALGEYAASLFEGPATEYETSLFEDAPEEALRLGVRRQDEKRRREMDEREAAERFQRQKDIITFREEEKKRLGTSSSATAAAKGPTPTQAARFDKTGSYLSRFAATDPKMAAFLDEAKRLERGESDPERYRQALESAFATYIDEKRALEARKSPVGYRGADIARAAELQDIERAKEDAYLFGRVPRGTAAPSPTTGGDPLLVQASNNPSATFPRADSAVGSPAGGGGGSGPFAPEPVDPAAPPQTDVDQEFDAAIQAGADPDAMARWLRSASPADLTAAGMDSGIRDYLLKKIDTLGVESAPPDVQARAPQVAGMQRTPMGEVAELGATIGNLGANTGRALAGLGIPAIDPSGDSFGGLFEQPGGVPVDIPQTQPDPVAFAQAGERWANYSRPPAGIPAVPDMAGLANPSALSLFAGMEPASTAQGLAAAAPGAPDMASLANPDVLGMLAQLLGGGEPTPQPSMQAEPGRNVFGKGTTPGRPSSNPDAMAGQQGPLPSLFGGPDALADDELAAIQDFLAKDEQRRRIEKLLRMMELVPR